MAGRNVRGLGAVVALAAVACALLPVATAHADGDPGSDVLYSQNLFSGTAAGLSVPAQARIGTLLRQARTAGFSLRVAIVGGPADLGSVTPLWRRPQAYATFLGTELSLSSKDRLLVVMPNGFGFNYPHHTISAQESRLSKIPTGTGGAALGSAATDAIRALAAQSDVTLADRGQPTSAASRQAARGAADGAVAQPRVLDDGVPRAPERSTDRQVGLIALAVMVLAGLGLETVIVARRRRAATRQAARPTPGQRLRPIAAASGVFAMIGLGIAVMFASFGASSRSQAPGLVTNPNVDPGESLSRPAPSFVLTDESDHTVSLRAYRGKAVLLAFNDSECTTTCPMTSQAMLQAKAMLGRSGHDVQLLGVEANPRATALEDVATYTQLHGLTGRWHFLTGSLVQLKRVWRAYGIEAEVQHGLVDHTPALFLISPNGEERRVYITQQSYAAVGQLAQVVARELSNVLPGHPAVHSDLSYAPIAGITPRETVSLPRAGDGRVILKPQQPGQLLLFFATWDRQITSLAAHLDALNTYQRGAAQGKLPPLTAVDEASVEPSVNALPTFLAALDTPLSYPVAIDATGRVADGYEVQGQPWLVLTSASGQIIWHQEVDTSGWPTPRQLEDHVRAALAQAPAIQTDKAEVRRELAGSSAPLAALHQQAGELLGNATGLMARIHALRGYPVVLNVWESSCRPCQAEFGLFAHAAAQYGRRVAFLGADANDDAGDAKTFLAGHPVSYPSYRVKGWQLTSLAAVGYYPTTIFINAKGKVVHTNIGQYDTQGTLDQNIAAYAH